jgi:hypothetical protein
METVRKGKVTVKVKGDVDVTVRIRGRAKRRAEKKPQRLELWRGPSPIDGKPVVLIATAIARPSKNDKTGKLIQTFILRRDIDPMRAAMEGLDRSICGDCPHRMSDRGTCYVNTVQAPLSVWRAWKAGRCPKYSPRRHRKLFEGRVVRVGSYGDPAMAPLSVWEDVCGAAEGWRGYTHQWRVCNPGFARLCMASVETPAQRLEAMAKGWRTFRVRTKDQGLEPGEIICPASAEAGKRLTCEQCRACSGSKDSPDAATVAIIFHGPKIAGNWRERRYEELVGRLMADEQGRFNLN